MDTEQVVEGMEKVSTLVEDADDDLLEEAKQLSVQIHSDVDFVGFRFDVILIALSLLISSLVAVIEEKAYEGSCACDEEDSRH